MKIKKKGFSQQWGLLIIAVLKVFRKLALSYKNAAADSGSTHTYNSRLGKLSRPNKKPLQNMRMARA